MMFYVRCLNSKCKNYYEDSCMIHYKNNTHITIDENGKCETYKEGIYDAYIYQFIDEIIEKNEYNYSVNDIVKGYDDYKDGKYISYTMKICVDEILNKFGHIDIKL